MPAIKIAAAVVFGLLALQMLAGTINTLLMRRRSTALFPANYVEVGGKLLRLSSLFQGVAAAFFASGCALVLTALWPLGLLFGFLPIGIYVAALRYKMITVLPERIGQ